LFLNEIFKRTNTSITEGGNLAVGGAQAQQIDLQVHNRGYMVPVLNKLLLAIDSTFKKLRKKPLWSPQVLQSREFLSGSSLHFFDTNIPDDQFVKVKPKVGDIDTQVDKNLEADLQQFLQAYQGKQVGAATFLGFERGNEQFSSLWEFQDPPIKIQIDFEFVEYQNDKPTDWSKFSHSSDWNDLQAGVKGVFHKFIIQSLSSLGNKEFMLRKMVGRGKARAEQDIPTTDNMLSFAVSSKEGGGLRSKYEPVNDPATGQPIVKDGLPVMRELPKSGYNQDVTSILTTLFGDRIKPQQVKQLAPKFWSFTGILEIMNTVLQPAEKNQIVQSFIDKIYAPGAQGLYKNDPQRDSAEKDAALNKMLQVLKVAAPADLAQTKQAYIAGYRRVAESLNEDEAPAVKAQFRKGMPHLHDLKALDFLDLLDEIHDGNGAFKLQNIPLNVKVDGFGGRFGKDAQGKPFMATSRTEPRYEPGFVAYHQKKGTTDPEILGRAQLFDDLFGEMMSAIKLVDSKLGPKFLINKQVTCEVLFLPFATETPEGKLKFVGIHYDKLPQGIQLALVPFRVVEGDTGEDLPNSNKFIKQLLSVGQSGSVMFVDNSLTQEEGLDVTALVPPLENLEQLKSMLADKSTGSLQRRRDVEASLAPVKVALEKAIIEDPNIIGKDILGKDYEGIVINSRLGPIKVTSQEQRDVITAKNAAKKAAWQEQPRVSQNKTAVVAIGSFVGHRGHEELFDYTVKKAAEVGGDAYLFIGNAEGKDDPIPPAVKVQTWHKMYPKYANNISTVQAGGSLIQKIKHELINPLPGKPPRYDNIIIMVGEDQAKMNIANALMKAVNKFQGYEHVKASLEATPRGTGMSFTKLRNILKDPNATPEQQYALWTQGFDEQKLGRDWIKHLMNITRKGMGIQMPQQPQQEPIAEAMLPTSTFTGSKKNKLGSAGQWKNTGPSKNRPARAGDLVGSAESIELDESNDIKGTLKTITNDIGEPITNVYETLKYMAKRFYDSHGDLKGFSMVAAGVGGRWFQTFYFNRLQNELYDLCKQNTKLTVGLQQFLRGSEVKGKLENAKGFNAVSKELPDILATIGAKIGYAPLANNARRWMQNREEYEQYLSDLELSDYEDDDDVEKAPKIPKDPAMGQQRSQAEEIVNDVLKKLPSKIAGDIRNAIARAPNKIQALQQELQKRGVKVPMESLDEACWKGYKQIGMKKKGGKQVPNCVPASEDMDEGWKSTLAGAALAGLGALGGGHAQAADLSHFNTQYLQQVANGDHPRPMISVDDAKAELQARANGKKQTVAPETKPQTSSGYSIDYLKKAADPERTGRYMISVEKAQELLKQQGGLQEHKRGVKAMKYTKKPKGIEPPKPRNPVAKNAMAGIGGGAAGAHKNKKKEAKHKHVEIGEAWEHEMSKAIRLLENK
jgi:hypothetical protein